MVRHTFCLNKAILRLIVTHYSQHKDNNLLYIFYVLFEIYKRYKKVPQKNYDTLWFIYKR